MNPFPKLATFVIAPIHEAAVEAIHPSEAALVTPRAVEKRHKELRAGRVLAHRALAQAGCPTHAAPILQGPRNEPLWPSGWAGAISHAERWACAVVAPLTATAGVGVDVESLERKVDIEIARIVCHDDERAWVGSDDARLKAIFSAKESIFKALYPVANVFLEFKDARVVATEGGFDAELLVPASPRHPAGFRMSIAVSTFDAHVLSALVLPP